MALRCFLLITLLLQVYTNVHSQIPLPRFDIQGHRGARGLKPENTIPAFLAALDTGVTTLEMDVVISHDRQVVVSHDLYMSAAICSDTLGNPITAKAEKKYNLSQMDYAQILKFDCGSRGNEKFPEQEKMKTIKPLLHDVIIEVENHIKNFSRYEVDYSIEIKSEKNPVGHKGNGKLQPPLAEVPDLLFELIDQYLPWNRVVIQSFDFRVLKYLHEKHPEVRLSALVENLKTIDENLKDLGFVPAVYSPEYKLLSKEEIKHCHELKMRVIPWTVNDLREMQELKTWNVDGIITDYPDRAIPLKPASNLRPTKGRGGR